MGLLASLYAFHIIIGNVLLGLWDGAWYFIFLKEKKLSNYIELALFSAMTNAVAWWIIWRVCLVMASWNITTPVNFNTVATAFALIVFLLVFGIKVFVMLLYNLITKKITVSKILKANMIIAITSNALVILIYMLSSVTPENNKIRVSANNMIPQAVIYFTEGKKLWRLDAGKKQLIEIFENKILFLTAENSRLLIKTEKEEKTFSIPDGSILQWHKTDNVVSKNELEISACTPEEIRIFTHKPVSLNLKETIIISFKTLISHWKISEFALLSGDWIIFIAQGRLYSYDLKMRTLNLVQEGHHFICIKKAQVVTHQDAITRVNLTACISVKGS